MQKVKFWFQRSFKWGTIEPCSSNGWKIVWGQSWKFEKEIVFLNPGSHIFESTLISKTIFSRSPTLTSSSLTALWATRLHSTSFERSDSYLFGFSLEIGITALLRYFISAQRYSIYLILWCTDQIRLPWPFSRFWRSLGLWLQFFALNQQIYVVSTGF